MLLFLLAMDPIILALGILPLLRLLLGKRMNIWLTGLAVIDGVVLAVVVFLAIRRLLQQDAALRAVSTPREEYRWQSGWEPEFFLKHLSLFIRLRGWRIVSTSVPARDRAGLIAQKENHRLALLCVRPDTDAVSADLDALDAMQCASRASRTVLVSQARPRPAGNATQARPPAPLLRRRQCPLFFQFDDLQQLDEALGLTR